MKEKLAALSAEDRRAIADDVREAIFHLASAWDALGRAERAIEEDIETDSISAITSDVVEPEDAYALSDDAVLEVLEAIDVN